MNKLLLQLSDILKILDTPAQLLFFGVLIVILAFIGRGAARGPATETPFTILLILGFIMILLGLIGRM